MNRRRILSLSPLALTTLLPRAVAAADGVISPANSREQNAAAIAGLIARLPAEGGVVQLPAGVLPCAPLVIDRSRVTLVGAGMRRTVLDMGETGDSGAVSVARGDNVQIADLTIAGRGRVAMYGYATQGLELSRVRLAGGTFATAFLDRCRNLRLSNVIMEGASTGLQSGGVGLWLIRGSTGRLHDIEINDCDSNGLAIDAGTTNDPDFAAPVGLIGSAITIRNVARRLPDSCGLLLAGARGCSISGLIIDGVGGPSIAGHGIVLEQDQSALVSTANVISGAVIGGVSGAAVALIGVHDNLVVGQWDGAGTRMSELVGARGAEPGANRVML